jgi:hypothetical protein
LLTAFSPVMASLMRPLCRSCRAFEKRGSSDAYAMPRCESLVMVGPWRLERQTSTVSRKRSKPSFPCSLYHLRPSKVFHGSNHGSKTTLSRYPTTGLWTRDPAIVSLEKS